MTRRPADEDKAGGRNTLTRFADTDLATPESNADLIGFEWVNDFDKATCTVLSVTSWSDQYVVVRLKYPDSNGFMECVKPAGLVRQRKERDT